MNLFFNRWRSRAEPPPPIPLLCQGPGRTGSTLLMELLLTSEEVLPERLFPHENRMLAALALSSMAFWRVPAEMPVEHRQRLDLIHQELQIRPTWPWLSDEKARTEGESMLWQQFLASNWQLLADRLRSRRPDGRFFAEKCGASLPWILKKAKMKYRLLLRTRDPRDHWCSLDAFNAKRGHELEGSNVPLRSAEERLPVFIKNIQAQYEPIFAKSASPPSHVQIVRYEELVTDLPSVARQLEQALKITLHPNLALERSAAHPEHRTSKSPADSVGRWKTDLDPKIGAILKSELGELFLRLGYEL